jgi:seryl-tRNA synthetase
MALVLRTVYLDSDIDNALREEALTSRTSKNDLINYYILLGMQVAREQREQKRLAEEQKETQRKARRAKKPTHADVLRTEFNALLTTIEQVRAQREKEDAQLNEQLAKFKALLDDTE